MRKPLFVFIAVETHIMHRGSVKNVTNEKCSIDRHRRHNNVRYVYAGVVRNANNVFARAKRILLKRNAVLSETEIHATIVLCREDSETENK